ncbi:MAG: hypothetical protein CVU23_06205 [Betaproteobacteria bacterium HGW-Betaproteobacteria-17]|jgi:hypothetical protein|uniref:DUF4224 domain-containing protein n=1 Tax=Hydrogenophaga sp. TaxID=1904254 RepID=UPI000CCA2E24|nr:DUF4224 domain-containing protein [Hydrogenophaga sp.]MDO8902941.1 DUF4224 domain-containing protein [Hydrogenophaga sp.]PKO71094.1 MAG: hypothetical protein CVU23_06205 [Betaproteobacteria bacterium HGW-Betaproteobacteria-17]
MNPTLTASELEAITGYRTPSRQLQTLHDRGFTRAYRNRLGEVVLERPHYDAVCRGEYARTNQTRPTVNTTFLRRAA